jgi:(2Fe-2S) ferredoxin
MKIGSRLTTSIVTLVLGASLALALSSMGAEQKANGQTETLKGEVVDLMCYLDHGAKGEKHAGCARKCIESGGPVGLLTPDGQLYLVIGEHKPMNAELAPKAAQTVTLKGKVVERNGMKMIENAQLED